MGSYDAELEYKEFAKINYRRMRGDIERAVEDAKAAGDNRPILLVIGEMQEPVTFSEYFNWMVRDGIETPTRAAAYPFLAAARVAEEMVGKHKVLLSFEEDPTLRGYCRKMANGTITSHNGSVSFRGFLSGFMQKEQFRVSYDDVKYSPGFEGQERFDAQIADINKVTKNVDPEIVIRYGSAKYFGALQGHPYEDILQLGNRLERNEALNPFDETFSRVLYYNAAYSGAARLGHKVFEGAGKAISYFENSANAIQLKDPPGAMPEDHKVKDIIQTMREVSKELRSAHKEDDAVSFRQTEQSPVISPITMKF